MFRFIFPRIIKSYIIENPNNSNRLETIRSHNSSVNEGDETKIIVTSSLQGNRMIQLQQEKASSSSRAR